MVTRINGLVLWPLLNPTVDEVISRWYMRPMCSINVHRADLWKLQGDILGSMVR